MKVLLASGYFPLNGRTSSHFIRWFKSAGRTIRQQSTTQALHDFTSKPLPLLSPPNNGPMKKYCTLLDKGALMPDNNQFNVVKHLQEFYNNLEYYMSARFPNINEGTIYFSLFKCSRYKNLCFFLT